MRRYRRRLSRGGRSGRCTIRARSCLIWRSPSLGGDCLADVVLLQAEPAVFGPVASDPTVSHLVGRAASGGKRGLAALRTARVEVRGNLWRLAGEAIPDTGEQVSVSVDDVFVPARSEKQDAAATSKKTFDHHPLTWFVDHARGGSGEPVSAASGQRGLQHGNGPPLCSPCASPTPMACSRPSSPPPDSPCPNSPHTCGRSADTDPRRLRRRHRTARRLGCGTRPHLTMCLSRGLR